MKFIKWEIHFFGMALHVISSITDKAYPHCCFTGCFQQSQRSCMQSITGDTNLGSAIETMTVIGTPTNSLQVTRLMLNGLRY